MAEQIPYAVAASLINRLASAAFHEFGRIYGVMDELERLKKTVESVEAVLLDAEDKQETQDHSVENWVRRLKDDVLHPADDLLDEFVIEETRHKMDEAPKNKVTQVLHSLSPKRISFRHKMAYQIENIQKTFSNVVKEMSLLNLKPKVVVVGESNNVRRETSSFVLESDIIGREDDKKEIISFLRQTNGNQHVSVVAIVGIGGLGKTALAQLLYNDGEVKKVFEKCMWVCVSNDFEVKTIVKKMFESLTKSKIDDRLSLDNLQNMLCANLAGKRYLLVLDDIWNESFEKWAQLRTYLMCGAQGSKVVVTTRSKIVAERMGVSVPHTLNGLTPEKSWSLLKNIITYGDETKGVSQTLETIGKKIAEKCSGVPLAIRTLGGILQGESEERKWINVLQGDFWESCAEEESIMPVLKLSYQNLSPQLRQCFAYCSLYPKNWNIVKDELIHLWMAQGYLECSDEKQVLENIGNQFVKIFFMKSFFQDVEIGDDGICSFKMHDLIHDLAMKVSGNDCCYLDRETKTLVGSPMHVMLKSDAIGFLESLDASRMRTIILLNTFSKKLNEEELFVISKFKYLRVLTLVNFSLSKFCDSIEKLKHLRYLKLYDCEELGSLSKSISNLVCLQTLILFMCKQVVISTKDISNLINLRHLEIENIKASDQKKITSRFGKLCVGSHKSVIISNWFSSLSLTNIVQISLWSCQDLQYLPPMERLPFLKSFSIYFLMELEFIYYEEHILSDSFFPSLEILNLYGCKKLKGWRRKKDDVNDDDNSSQLYHLSFPCLSELQISFCPELSDMPTFPKLDKSLALRYSKVEALEATLKTVGSTCSVDFSPLSMLKYLHIGGYVPNEEKLPEDLVQNLTSLKHLEFSNLRNQKIQEIGIWFKNDHNYLPFLESITFFGCEDLEALPDWICSLSSLHRIKLANCECLASLPEGMSRLAKLHTLRIIGCPLLIEECETQTSATWPKIAHIPCIILKR